MTADTGTHVIVDLHGAENIDNEETVREAIAEIVRATV